MSTSRAYCVGGCEPSIVTTVTSMVRIFAEGSGSERQLKVSMVTELKLQSGQTSVDLYMPCNSHRMRQ